MSLHQVPHYIGQGVPTHLAALTASVFAFGQVPAGFFWSVLAQKVPLRMLLSAAAATIAVGAIGTGLSSSLSGGIPMGFLLGFGVGGLHLLLRLTWADYYGRLHLGAIRGLTLPAQIGGQAMGPIIAGFMFDATGGYETPFTIFGILVAVAAVVVLAATPPGPLLRRRHARPVQRRQRDPAPDGEIPEEDRRQGRREGPRLHAQGCQGQTALARRLQGQDRRHPVGEPRLSRLSKRPRKPVPN